jgi:hypothetical protein
MSQIKLKTESLPTRCEICHQVDLFDATSNFCHRCSTLAQHYQPLNLTISNQELSLIGRCQSTLENFGLSIGQVFAITLILFLTLLGATISNLTVRFINISTPNIIPLATSFGAVVGFLSLVLIAKLLIRHTSMKLAPFIDLKVKILIKNSKVTK